MQSLYFYPVRKPEILAGKGFDHCKIPKGQGKGGCQISYYLFSKKGKYDPNSLERLGYTFLPLDIREKIRVAMSDNKAYRELKIWLIEEYTNGKMADLSPSSRYCLSEMEDFPKILDIKFMSGSDVEEINNLHGGANIIKTLIVAKKYLIKVSMWDAKYFLWMFWDGKMISPLGRKLDKKYYRTERYGSIPIRELVDLWDDACGFIHKLEDLRSMESFNDLLSPEYKKILDEYHPMIDAINNGVPLSHFFMKDKFNGKIIERHNPLISLLRPRHPIELHPGEVRSEFVESNDILFLEYMNWKRNLVSDEIVKEPIGGSSQEYKEWFKLQSVESEKSKCWYLELALFNKDNIHDLKSFNRSFKSENIAGYDFYKKKLPIIPTVWGIYKK